MYGSTYNACLWGMTKHFYDHDKWSQLTNKNTNEQISICNYISATPQRSAVWNCMDELSFDVFFTFSWKIDV